MFILWVNKYVIINIYIFFIYQIYGITQISNYLNIIRPGYYGN